MNNNTLLKKVEWSIYQNNKQKFTKNASFSAWNDFVPKVDGIINFLSTQPEFYEVKLPKQVVYFDRKKDDYVTCYTFELYTDVCVKAKKDIFLLDVGTYLLDDIMDHFNTANHEEDCVSTTEYVFQTDKIVTPHGHKRNYFTDWGMVMNFYIIED